MASESLASPIARPHERGFSLSIGKYWERISFSAIVILSAILNFYGLSREGYGNTYYAAAVKSMLQNWHAFFFNSLDPAGFVSIDKPPLGFWLQVLSAKIFGYSGVALMLPQALAGVGSVILLYYLVGRVFGRPTGLIAALALAVTPISVVANRNNIVDSTLVFAVLLGAWAVSKAVRTGKLRWLLLCAVFVGLGFNIKMLQAFLVVPAFGLMYLLGARVGWGKRLLHLVLATVVLLIVSLSWVTVVDLTPASDRPWVGSTTDNSELSLAIGYNGLQRLTGNSAVGGGQRSAVSGTGGSSTSTGSGSNTGSSSSTGSGGNTSSSGNTGPGNGGGPGGVGENGPTGVLRLLDTQLGAQIGWLLPLAVIGFVAAAWQTRRRWPLSEKHSALVMWGTWLLTMGVFFSIAGFFHTYYLVMVAPAIAALSAIGLISLWQMHRQPGSRLWFLLPAGLVTSTAVEVHVLSAYPAWSRWLSPLIMGLAILGALILVVLRVRLPATERPGYGAGATGYGLMRARLMILPMLLAIAGLLAAPAVWSVESVQAADSGITPRAGPAGTNTSGPGGITLGSRTGSFRPPNGNGGSFQPPAGAPSGPPGGNGAGGPPGGTGSFGPPTGTARGGAPGGAGGTDQVNKQLLKYLEAHQGTATYLFATTGAGTAEPYIIATGKAVMAMGGFTGSDPILNASKVATLVKEGQVRYFLINGQGGGFGGGSGSTSAVSWVQSNCTVVPASKYSSSSSTTGGNAGGSLYDCGSIK